MNKYLSDKLKIISFISILLVVFIHSYNLTVNFNSGNIDIGNSYNVFLQEYISQGIATVAVPLFFCISGYLFFLNFNGTTSAFLLKFRKRIKSLLLPYLIWSLWGLLFYFILQLFPQSQNFFTKKLIVDYSLNEFANTIFISPIPYQLWFLRDLIMLVLFSPAIFWLIKKTRILLIIFLLAMWFNLLDLNFYIFGTESLLFFTLGAYLALYQKSFLLKKIHLKNYWILLILWFTIVFIKTSLLNSEYTFLYILAGKISVIIGISTIWISYDNLMKNKLIPNTKILNLSIYSFFIFVFHEPFLTFFKKGMFYISGTSDLMVLINYFTSPLVIITLSIIVGFILSKVTPRFYHFITGGR